jgi:hypothetical protein
MVVFGHPRHGVSWPPGQASFRSYVLLLQRHAEPGFPPGRHAEVPQKWREMAVFQRNSSVCTLVCPGGFWVGARETLSVVSFCRDQGELTDNRAPRQTIDHEVSWSLTLASFAPESGAAVALRAQGNEARCVLDGQVPLRITEGAVDLYVLLDKDAP